MNCNFAGAEVIRRRRMKVVAGWRGGQMKRRGGAKSGQGLFEDPVPDEGQRSARIKDQDVEQSVRAGL